MAGTRTYPDLRYLFMRGLISHEVDQRSRHYLKSAAECTSRAIVSLELSDEPIKSVKQARKLEAIGGETCSRLSKLESEKSFSSIKPLGGRFVSSAGGILVGLLDATEEMLHNGHNPDKDVLVPEDNVRRRAERLTEEPFTDGVNEFCKAWWRLEVIIKRGYIRRRSLKKSPVLQLLPLGKATALHLRERVGRISTGSALSCRVRPSALYTDFLPLLPNLTSSVVKDELVDEAPITTSVSDNSRETTQVEQEIFCDDSLYTNDKGQDGLVMLVDRREMGGEKYGLGELCRLLGDRGVCYKTKHLMTGDYSWIWRTDGREVILPCLVERKRADDIACTLKDGRFWSQVNNMKDWKAEFMKKGVESTIHYILERKPEEFVVKCSDGCRGILKCGNPTLTQVKMVIEDLKHHPDLLVKETPSLEVTAVLLASFTNDLRDRVGKGDFDCLLQEDLAESKTASKVVDAKSDEYFGIDGSKKLPSVNNDNEYNGNEDCNDIRTSAPGTDFSNLSFDEELRIVLERSKHEIRKTDNVIDLNNVDNKSLEEATSDVTDIDEELALVLERSKYEIRGIGSDNSVLNDSGISDSSDYLPLMQYHCTDGGSLYSTKFRDKNHGRDLNEYRPRINRRKSSTVASTCSSWTDSSDKVQNLKSTSETKANASVVEKLSCDSKSLNSLNDRLLSDSVSLGTRTSCVATSSGKRKCSKNTFSFKSNPDHVEELWSSNGDKDVTSCKKMKTVLHNFTPSKECIESYDNGAKVARGKTKQKSRRKFRTDSSNSVLLGDENEQTCKSNTGEEKVRLQTGKGVNYKSHSALNNEFSPGIEPSMKPFVEFEEKVKKETDSVDLKEKQSRVPDSRKSEENEEYHSDADIFLDTSDEDSNHNLKYFGEESETSIKEELDDFEINSQQSESGNLISKYSKSKHLDSVHGVCTVRNTNLVMDESSDSSNDSLPDIVLDTNNTDESVKHDIYVVKDYQRSNPTDTSVSVHSSHVTRHTNSTLSADRISDKVNLVLSVLPHVDRLQIRDILVKCGLNVDLCITELLDNV